MPSSVALLLRRLDAQIMRHDHKRNQKEQRRKPIDYASSIDPKQLAQYNQCRFKGTRPKKHPADTHETIRHQPCDGPGYGKPMRPRAIAPDFSCRKGETVKKSPEHKGPACPVPQS